MTTAAAAGVAPEAKSVGSGTPGWLIMWRVELVKLAAQLRVRAVLLVAVFGPLVIAGAMQVTNFTPGDTLFGIWIHESGFAFSLVVLYWVGLWALPMSISVVAGDMSSGEHRLGTWPLLLTRSRSRLEVMAGKMLAAATYSVVITLLFGVSTTVVGLVAVGHQPLVGLDGSTLSSHAALLATLGSWVSQLPPALAITAIALLVSVLSRNSWVGVLVTVGLVLVLNLVVLVSSIDPVRPFLPITGVEAWHGLVRAHTYTDQIWTSLAVNLVWMVVCFGLSATIFTRRDVVDS